MGIKIQQLSKTFEDTSVLKNISMAFDQNGVIGLLGPNGAGKTTLMKILTGYLNQWHGNIEIGGLDVRQNLKKVQKQMGYLPENNPLYPEMYVKEYLKFSGDLYALNELPIDQVVKRTGLTDHVHKKIGTLSKGYKQRVGLAAALLHDPKYLILDEPTSGLDPNQVIEIRKLIQKLGKEKLVFLSTHIIQEVEAICDRVVILNKGEVILNQTLDELKNDDRQVVTVSFDYRIENVALQKIPNTKTVVNTHDFEYELTFETQKDMRPAIFDFAHDNELKILKLNRRNKTLEQLFRDLTN